MNLLNGASFERLQGAIDASALRHKVVANNIANGDTPYFKRSEVSFESILQNEMSGQGSTLVGLRTDPRHFFIGPHSASPAAQVNTDQNTMFNNNLNNVDIDREMSLMAENQLRYNTFIQQLNHDIKMKRVAIEGRG